MKIHKILGSFLSIVTVLVLFGAGCSNAQPTPGYVKDAADFGQTQNLQIPASSSTYQAPGPATSIGLPTTEAPPAATVGGSQPAVSVPVVKTAPKPTTESATADYLKALTTYKDVGYYIQFVKCHGTPGVLVVKKGVKVMLDNTDDSGHTLGFDGKLYGLGSFRYVIVTPLKVGPAYITCDGGGSAQLSVQP